MAFAFDAVAFFAAGEERTLDYWFGNFEDRGPVMAISNRVYSGGPYLATGQGVRAVGSGPFPHQEVKYTVRIRNFGSAGGMRLRGGNLV